MTKGQLVAVEGIDGSGKTTQIELLIKYLVGKNISFEVISFPRYEDNLYGNLIKRYLSGEFGSVIQANPYLMALTYASDRGLAKPLIENWLNEGKLVILNRYVSSSKAHLSANLPEDKREEFMNWIEKLEYETNKMPREDLTILLNVDPKSGYKNVEGGIKDIHEDSIKHLDEAFKIYLELSKAEDNWKVVECMREKNLKSKEDIHKLVVEIVNPYLVS